MPKKMFIDKALEQSPCHLAYSPVPGPVGGQFVVEHKPDKTYRLELFQGNDITIQDFATLEELLSDLRRRPMNFDFQCWLPVTEQTRAEWGH